MRLKPGDKLEFVVRHDENGLNAGSLFVTDPKLFKVERVAFAPRIQSDTEWSCNAELIAAAVAAYHKTDSEAASAIAAINAELWDGAQAAGIEDFDLQLKFVTTGTYSAVEFCDIVLWDTEDHQHEYVDDGDTFEPVETCIRRRLDNHLKLMDRVRLAVKVEPK